MIDLCTARFKGKGKGKGCDPMGLRVKDDDPMGLRAKGKGKDAQGRDAQGALPPSPPVAGAGTLSPTKQQPSAARGCDSRSWPVTPPRAATRTIIATTILGPAPMKSTAARTPKSTTR